MKALGRERAEVTSRSPWSDLYVDGDWVGDLYPPSAASPTVSAGGQAHPQLWSHSPQGQSQDRVSPPGKSWPAHHVTWLPSGTGLPGGQEEPLRETVSWTGAGCVTPSSTSPQRASSRHVGPPHPGPAPLQSHRLAVSAQWLQAHGQGVSQTWSIQAHTLPDPLAP